MGFMDSIHSPFRVYRPTRHCILQIMPWCAMIQIGSGPDVFRSAGIPRL
jgi:hypothetical protein